MFSALRGEYLSEALGAKGRGVRPGPLTLYGGNGSRLVVTRSKHPLRLAALGTSPSTREPKHGQASKGQYQPVPVDHANTMNPSESPVSEGGTIWEDPAQFNANEGRVGPIARTDSDRDEESIAEAEALTNQSSLTALAQVLEMLEDHGTGRAGY